MIESKLNVEAISFSNYNTKEFVKKSFSILFQRLVLTTFITENARSVVVVDWKSKHKSHHSINKFVVF